MTLSRRLATIARPAPMPYAAAFGAWRPDEPDLGNSLIAATNVIPSDKSYRPFKQLSVVSDALTARAQGAISLNDTTGNAYFYAGDATKLYDIRDQSATDRSGTTYATASDGQWEFSQYGNQVIATNYVDAVQQNTIGAAANFSDLIASTNKPKARHCDVLGEFLVLGNTNDTTDGVKPNRVWWSAIGDVTDFDPSATTLCDFQDIATGGAVQRVVGGFEYGLVFQSEQINRMTFVGPPLAFEFFPVDRKRGTPVPGSVAAFGRFCFFVAEDGFYLHDGSQSNPIGRNQVDRTFWNQFDATNAHRVTAAIDPYNQLYMIAFPGAGSAGVANKLFIFSWKDQRWAEIDIMTEIIVAGQSQGYTLEGLDAIDSNLDTLTPSLDAGAWKGGAFRLAAFDTSHKLNHFDGANMAATIETGEIQLVPGRRALVTRIRPIVQGTSPTIKVISSQRNRLTAATSANDAALENTIGDTSQRADGRYHRFKIQTNQGDDWDHLQGVEIHFAPRGMR